MTPITTFVIFQVSALLFAAVSALEEEAWSYPYRNLSWDLKTKKDLLKTAHTTGAAGVFIVLMGYALGQFFNTTGDIELRLFASFFCFVSCGLIYWTVFDIAFALSIGKDPFYLGEYATTDNWLTQWLGKNAGLKKAIGSVVLIIAINLTYKIFI